VEHCTAHEGGGVNAVLQLTRDAIGPLDPVRGFFAAAGAMRRCLSGGWVDAATGEPTLAGRAELAAAWRGLRAGFDSGLYALTPIAGSEFDTRFTRLGGGESWRCAPDGTISLRNAAPHGYLVVDGERITAPEYQFAPVGPRRGGLLVCNEWNQKLLLVETATHYVLARWSTSA
jgi:hypothetical protein